MDFLNKATKDLDIDKVKDKLPGQVKDKIPGGKGGGSHAEGKGHGGKEGDHAASSGSKAKDDGKGFPDGLRPSDWMGDLVKNGQVPDTAMVTEFRYPGSHDCATYGSGLASFSYQCQEKSLYDQMMTGQRAFDLRLTTKDKKFIPYHGEAKGTAPDFNENSKEAGGKDNLSSEILRFAKEHPTEIIILKIKVDGLLQKETANLWSDTAWAILGERLLAAPKGNQEPVTHSAAVQSNRNIILAMSLNAGQHAIEPFIWDSGHVWIGDGSQLLWNEPTWQSGKIEEVIQSTEKFIKQNESKLEKRDKFWGAFLQLTPVLGQGITTFIKDGGSISPKDLALGGGIGTHGSFKGSNQELRNSGIFKQELWKKYASVIFYDFCDTHTSGDIVSMNIGGDFPRGSGAASSADDRAGGRGGGHAGRGGRGGHEDDAPGGRGGHGGGAGRGGDNDDDDDGPGGRGGGRGGHRGGRGRGGHD